MPLNKSTAIQAYLWFMIKKLQGLNECRFELRGTFKDRYVYVRVCTCPHTHAANTKKSFAIQQPELTYDARILNTRH
jgi:hypothetical protein